MERIQGCAGGERQMCCILHLGPTETELREEERDLCVKRWIKHDKQEIMSEELYIQGEMSVVIVTLAGI